MVEPSPKRSPGARRHCIATAPLEPFDPTGQLRPRQPARHPRVEGLGDPHGTGHPSGSWSPARWCRQRTHARPRRPPWGTVRTDRPGRDPGWRHRSAEHGWSGPATSPRSRPTPTSATVRPSPSTAYSSMGRNPSWRRGLTRAIGPTDVGADRGDAGPPSGGRCLLAGIELLRQAGVGEHRALGGGKAPQEVVERMERTTGAIR